MIFTTVQILVREGLTMPRPYFVDLTFYQKMTKPVKILQRSTKNYAPNALVVKCALLILPDLDKSLLRFLPDLLNSVWLQLWVDNPNKGTDQPALRYSTTIEAQLPMITWKKDKRGPVHQDASGLDGSWGIFIGPADVFVYVWVRMNFRIEPGFPLALFFYLINVAYNLCLCRS